MVLLIKAVSVPEYPRIPLLLLVQAFFATLHMQITWPERCFIGPYTTITTNAPSLVSLIVWMISRCTRKERQDRLRTDSANQPSSCSTLLGSSTLLCRPHNVDSWHGPHCVFRLAGKGFRYFFNQTCKRFGCGCFPLVATQFPLQEKEQNVRW